MPTYRGCDIPDDVRNENANDGEAEESGQYPSTDL